MSNRNMFAIIMIAAVLALKPVFAEEQKDTIVKTANQTGWTFTGVYDKFSQAYVDFAAQDYQPTLELGAGRGATAAALAEKRASLNNKAELIVNDIGASHLEEAKVTYPVLNQTNIKMLPGKFPETIDFKNNTFNSILASRFFHFLTPEEWQLGLKKIYSWLKPGGRFYITTGTYFIGNQKNNIKDIQLKKEKGELWPATFKSGQEAYGEGSKSGPATLVDRDILIRELKLAGFEILYEDYMDGRSLLPASFCLDGKEGVGVIAIKPISKN